MLDKLNQRHGGRALKRMGNMTDKQFQKSANTLIGTILETLESYNLPESQVNTVKRIAWAEVDKQFGRFIDE